MNALAELDVRTGERDYALEEVAWLRKPLDDGCPVCSCEFDTGEKISIYHHKCEQEAGKECRAELNRAEQERDIAINNAAMAKNNRKIVGDKAEAGRVRG